jgi:hypothetical protein
MSITGHEGDPFDPTVTPPQPCGREALENRRRGL